VVQEVGGGSETLAAELTFVVAFTGVHTAMNNQRVLASKGFATKLTKNSNIIVVWIFMAN